MFSGPSAGRALGCCEGGLCACPRGMCPAGGEGLEEEKTALGRDAHHGNCISSKERMTFEEAAGVGQLTPDTVCTVYWCADTPGWFPCHGQPQRPALPETILPEGEADVRIDGACAFNDVTQTLCKICLLVMFHVQVPGNVFLRKP